MVYFKMKNKTGQMFIIAALVIVVIIMGVFSTKVAVRTYRENTRVADYVDEIELEGVSVVDHGTYIGLTKEETTAQIEELISYYTEANPNAEIKVVVGNQDGYTVTTGKWKEVSNVCSREIGCLTSNIPIISSEEIPCSPKCDKAIITSTLGNTYDFDLTDRGINFYVVFINTEDNGEITVATNKPK